jgi:hypothetical protein
MVFVLFLTANNYLDSLVLFASMATSSIHQTNALLLTPTVRLETRLMFVLNARKASCLAKMESVFP